MNFSIAIQEDEINDPTEQSFRVQLSEAVDEKFIWDIMFELHIRYEFRSWHTDLVIDIKKTFFFCCFTYFTVPNYTHRLFFPSKTPPEAYKPRWPFIDFFPDSLL